MQVRYPHEQHGLAGKQSNQAKTVVKEGFLQFVDINSQAKGRRDDSSSATHYFLPKFRTIQTPKKRVRHYQERVETSVVGVFNAVQTEANRGTCSNGSASAWLRRPKVAIYPHQADYCDTCARIKESVNGMQTTLKRKRQTGSATEEEQKQIEANISSAEGQLATHRQYAAKSREFYTEMTIRCKEQWQTSISS